MIQIMNLLVWLMKMEILPMRKFLADESPVRHSRLFCTRWNGLTKASGIVDALDDKEYSGSLVTLLQSERNSLEIIQRRHGGRWMMAE